MDHRPHIVVVEDEATQRQLLCDYLDKQNFRVSPADGGVALRRLLERELPALVLLDVGLPGEDGFALARWLREKSGRIGIIMVTAASDTVDRVVGLETGADDYIGKPYEPRELLARIKSVLRRSTGAPATSGPRVRMGRRVPRPRKACAGRSGRRQRGDADGQRIRPVEAVRRKSQPAVAARLAAGVRRPPRDGGLSTAPLISASPGCAAKSRPIRRIPMRSAPSAASATCSFRPKTERDRIDQTRIKPDGRVEPKGFPNSPMQARFQCEGT
jgi:DNA-binding response OmpR family regulator